MAKIRPFRAVIYNQEKIGDLSRVVCPPYDIVSPAQQQYFHRMSFYNFLHILLGSDIKGENKYRRAANYFKDWQKGRVLIQDEKPAAYFYSTQYKLRGESKTRLGFIARLYLEDKQSKIFLHEHTRLEPKEDRYRLLKAVKANLSPIFTIFSDKKRIIRSIYQEYIEDREPFINIRDIDGVIHKLWRIDSVQTINKIQESMQKIDIFIADGHHRYEVACTYRDEMRKKSGRLSEDSDVNYILTYFTNIESSGITILPVHRIVKMASEKAKNHLISKLQDYFTLEIIKDKLRLFFFMEKAGRTENVIGMYGDKKCWLLRLKNIKILEKIIKDKSRASRSVDVNILNEIILKNILGLELEDKGNIVFGPNAEELIEKADSSKSTSVVFVLNPVKVEQLVSVSMNGERMPSKSTYFYPKVLSGLVINKHENI